MHLHSRDALRANIKWSLPLACNPSETPTLLPHFPLLRFCESPSPHTTAASPTPSRAPTPAPARVSLPRNTRAASRCASIPSHCGTVVIVVCNWDGIINVRTSPEVHPPTVDLSTCGSLKEHVAEQSLPLAVLWYQRVHICRGCSAIIAPLLEQPRLEGSEKMQYEAE